MVLTGQKRYTIYLHCCLQWIMWWFRSGSQNMGVQFWATIGPALVIQLAEPRPVSRAPVLLIQDLDSLWTLIHCCMWTERGCVAHHWARITLLFGRLSPALCQLRAYSEFCGCYAWNLPGPIQVSLGSGWKTGKQDLYPINKCVSYNSAETSVQEQVSSE